MPHEMRQCIGNLKIHGICIYDSSLFISLCFKTFNPSVQIQKCVSGGRNSVLVTGRKKILADC